MSVFRINENTNVPYSFDRALEILFRDSQVNSAPKNENFRAYGDGIAASNFFIGNIVNEHSEHIRIHNNQFYILALPYQGSFQVTNRHQKVRNSQGEQGSLTLPSGCVSFGDATDYVNDYIILMHESEITNYLSNKYNFSPSYDQVLGLIQKDKKISSLFHYIQSALNLTHNFPESNSARFLEGNLKEIAKLMLSDLIVDLFQIKTPVYYPSDQAIVSSAKELIDSECTDIYTVEEIANRLDTSVRILQKAFKDNSHTTPMRFLRERKLYKAREILSSAQNPAITVKSVAQRVGVLDINRFSQYYFRLFGETPGETLRKAKA